MFCAYCGTNLPDDSLFCNKCGKPQNSTPSTLVTNINVLTFPSLSNSTLNVGGAPDQGHHGAVYKVVWSPDGKHIVSGSDDNEAHIWDANSGNTLVTYRGHFSPVNVLSWLHDSKYVVSGCIQGLSQIASVPIEPEWHS